MMKSKYVVLETDSSFCPRCAHRVRLLMRENGIRSRWPAFYLCVCGFIGQVGVGPVHGMKEADDEVLRANT